MILPGAISLHGFENAILPFCGAAIMIAALLVWVIWKR